MLNRLTMFLEFYHDFQHYKKWNYNNPKVRTQAAQDAKIFRQTHMIEKGMSLSKPRKGFGEKKIIILFEMLDRYLTLGFSPKCSSFQNAIYVLNSYIEMQKKMNYINPSIIKKIEMYQTYLIAGKHAGVVYDSNENIMRQAKGSYPEFFYSRHSMRQFSEKPIRIEDIKKVIALARKAPTACNRQACHVYMYMDKETNVALGNLIAGNTGFSDEVNKYLVVTADVSAFYDSFERNQIYIESGIYAMALVEALHFYGIGSCILQNGEYYKKNKKFKEICKNIKENERITVFIAIGYYKENFAYAISMRKKVDDILIIK